MADEVDKIYYKEFSEMVQGLGVAVTSKTLYDTFANTTRCLFGDTADKINLGRIVALWSFGYEIAVSVIIKEDTDVKILSQMIDTLVDAFLKDENNVAGWIKDHGGWVALLDKPKIDVKVWLESELMQPVAATSRKTNHRFELPVKREKDKEQNLVRSMAEAFSPNLGAERDKEPPNHDSFESFTRIIFRSFMFQRLTKQILKRQISMGRIPTPVLEMFFEEEWPNEAREIAKVLAEMADDLDNIYKQLGLTAQSFGVGVTSETAYDTFAGTISSVFGNEINWGKIVASLSFGYELTVSVITEEDTDVKICSQMIDTLVDGFLKDENNVAGWIKDHGGWVSTRFITTILLILLKYRFREGGQRVFRTLAHPLLRRC
eukprot:Seg339.4 transcript_id=Seg339.4/GoldUCD/mRNA.D3Y31 product="Apoptosis regulator R11" protein_id=Seg339.4/GoldUCD/D3Y31